MVRFTVTNLNEVFLNIIKKTWLPNGLLGFFGHLSNLFIVINLSEAALVGPESVISTFPLQDVPGVLLSPVRGSPGFP